MISAETSLFDLSFLEQMDDKAFLVQVISLYVQDTSADLSNMSVAFTAGKLDLVYQTAHKLKSSTGMLQANTLFSILEKTEKNAKAGNPDGSLGSLIENCLSAFDQLKIALEVRLTELEAA